VSTRVGATGWTVAQNLVRLRKARGLSLRELSGMLERTQPINPDGLNRAEKGTRQVSTDELVALAVTLGVNPSALLLPLESHGQTEITGAGAVDLTVAWDWADGKRPLDDNGDGQAGVDFQDLARPPKRRGYNFQTPAGRRRVGQIYDQVDGAEVVRNEDGDVVEVRLPGGVQLFSVRGSDGG
jgi:transcriptional regulator with XRE-family HTH domain